MLDLRDLIIQRIDECQGLSDRVRAYLADAPLMPSLDCQIQHNRGVLKLLAHCKSRQKYRVKMQEELLQDLKSEPLGIDNTVDQFYRAGIAIFSKYNPSQFVFRQKGISTEEKVQKIFQAFLQSNQTVKLTRDAKAALQLVNEQSVVTLMEWVCTWSKGCLMSCLQTAMSEEIQRHEDQMKRISNLKSSALLSRKEKVRISFPSLLLTNKESVYSLFQEDLVAYYKELPAELDLDISFPKTMRKTHPKGNELQKQENLRRAAAILMESTNKLVRGSIESFRTQYVNYFERYLVMSTSLGQKQDLLSVQLKKISEQSPQKGVRRYNIKKTELQRIKSESHGLRASRQQKGSLLLRPKANEISFESSKEIMNKLQRRRQKQKEQQILFPEITQAKSSGGKQRSSEMRNKPMHNFFECNNRSLMANYQKMPKSCQQVNPKFSKFESRQPLSIEKLLKKEGYSCASEERQQIFSHEELKGKKEEGEELRKNRKLMLQLLREKSRHMFLQR